MTPKHDDALDVFLSFAGPDEARAEVLFDQLKRLGISVFFSDRSIEHGDSWKDSITRALRRCRAVAVLLSKHSAVSDYQEEEILFATRLAKQQPLKLIPVYLDGVPKDPADWEFGLQRKDFIDQQAAGGPAGTAQKFGELLLEPPEPQSTTDPAQVVRTYRDVFHNANLKIDRANQWLPIIETCSSQENALFLLHGTRLQNLELFVSRVWHFLAAECQVHHRPFAVPLRVEYVVPRSSAAWENNLKRCLAEAMFRKGATGTAEDLLQEAARSHAVFLVLGKYPISIGDSSDEEALDEAEISALEEFLADRLPRMMASAARGRHPIRALLALQYERKADELVARLDQKAFSGSKAHGLAYRKLRAVRALEWEDIQEFLDNLPVRPPMHIVNTVRDRFESLDRGKMEYREIVEMLNRTLY